jgi:hypothetical protein
LGLILFAALPIGLGWLAIHLLLDSELGAFWRASGFIVCATLALVYLKSFLPRRLPEPPAVIPLSREDQAIAYAFVDQVARDIGAPAPRRLWVGSGVELRLSSRRSLFDLVRIGKWDVQVGLWLWQHLTLSEFQAVVARTLAPLSRGGFERWRFAVHGLLQALIVGDDFLDEMGDSGTAFAGIARLLSGVHNVLVYPLRWLAALLLRIGRQMDDALSDDVAAVRICGSDSLVHAVLRADFAGATLKELDRLTADAAKSGLFTADLYAHQPLAAEAIWKAHNDFTLGQPPTLRGPNAGKYADVFEPGQAYFSTMWRNLPSPGEREQNAKKTFVAAERDERPAGYLIEEAMRLRERLTRLRFVEYLETEDDYLPLPPEVVAHWLETQDAEPFPARYAGSYDDYRAIDPGAPAELDAALRHETWEDRRLLSMANGLYLQAGERATRWRAGRKAIEKIQRRSLYRPTGRDRALADDLEDDLRKITFWLSRLDQRAYVVHVHMAARLPTLELHEALLRRYESVLRFQVLPTDVAQYRNRVAAFVRRLDDHAGSVPYRLGREAMREFQASFKDLDVLLQEVAAIEDPLLAGWAGGLRLDRFLYAHQEFPSKRRGGVLATGRRLLRAWDEILGKSRWLHQLGVAALLATHQQIVEQFMTQAVDSLTSIEPDPDAVPDEVSIDEREVGEVPDAIVIEPARAVNDTELDISPDVLELEVERPSQSETSVEDPWGPR